MKGMKLELIIDSDGVENDIYLGLERKPRGAGPNLHFIKGVGGPPQ